MLIRCEMLKKLANAFIEVAKEENLPIVIFTGRFSSLATSIKAFASFFNISHLINIVFSD